MSAQEDQCARAGDATLYVLGDLHGRQQQSFERHLRRCEDCADEVGMLQQAALGTPLLGEAYLPPEEEDDPGRRAATPTLAVAAANARAARLAAEKAAAESGLAPPTRPPTRPVLRTIQGGEAAPPPRRSLLGGRRLLKTPMPRSVMVSFVALGVLAVATVAMSSQGASVHFARIQAGWSKGGAALKFVGDKLELLVEDMPTPAHGTGYEVWVVNHTTKQLVPTGAWVHLNKLHQAGVNVPGDYHDWDAIAIYVEPLTGDDRVQTGAVAVGDLRGLK